MPGLSYRYFDGSSLIAVNGEVRAQGSQFAIKEVEVITANVDLDEVIIHTSLSVHHMPLSGSLLSC